MAGSAVMYRPAPRPVVKFVKDNFGQHFLMDDDAQVARLSWVGWSVPSKTEKDTWHILDREAALEHERTNASIPGGGSGLVPGGWHPVREGVEQSNDGKELRFWSRGRWITVW